MKALLSLLAALVVTSCASHSDAHGWKKEDVIGFTLSIVDDAAIESYRFQAEGHAIAHFGVKGGPVAGPVVDWKIDDGRLIIFDEDRTRRRLTLVEMKGTDVVTRTQWGRTLKWRLTR